ncbi:MAG: tetratricopeptide repeat protein [Deltaproteobacteria bacterium]|nr:tetratricopeptide repeat protein [Deltaproteobacteria bacterium]
MIHVERFKDYYLTRRIGVGGMAEIFRGRKIGEGGFEKPVVVKRLLTHLASDESFRAMFLDEARLASQLSHPNIVHVYDLGKYIQGGSENYFIAMEYVFGKNLAEIRNQAAARNLFPSIEHIARIVSGAALALHHAHFRMDDCGKPLNIVHRDVSPQNILLSYEGEVKLADFGIAKALTKSQHTQAGVLKGKLAYMSPEQARGESIDYRADIYALGIVLWELLTAKRLFVGDNEAATLRNVLEPTVCPPTEIAPHVPPELDAMCLRCLAVKPEDRYPNAMALAKDLEKFLHDSGLTSGSHALRDYLRGLFAKEIEEENAQIQEEALAVRRMVGAENKGVEEKTLAAEPVSDGTGSRSENRSTNSVKPKRSRRPIWVMLAIGGLAILGIGGLLLLSGNDPQVNLKDTPQPPSTSVETTEAHEDPSAALPVEPASEIPETQEETDIEKPSSEDLEASRLARTRSQIEGLVQAGQVEDALAILDQAEDRRPWSVPELGPARSAALKALAAGLQDGDPERAVAILREIAAHERDNAQTYLTLGRMLTRLGRIPEAIESYDLALLQDERLHEAHYNNGVLWLRLGRMDLAERALLRTLALNPPYSADIYVNLAACKAQGGAKDEAVAYLRKALEIDPGHEIARYNLNVLAFQP